MIQYTVRRVVASIPALIAVVIVVFAILRLIPGDPARYIGGENMGEDALQQLRERLHLNDPLPQQFLDYVTGLAQLDLGTSLLTQLPVIGIIGDALSITVLLAVTSVVIGVLISVPAGVLAAYSKFRGKDRTDNAVMGVVMLLDNVPSFWLALLLMMGLSVQLGLFPMSGDVGWDDPGQLAMRLAMPIIVLAVGTIASLTRVTRAAVLETLDKDYVRTARSLGTSERTILFSHALPNASLPIVTMTGLSLGRLIAGTIIVESIFSIPGIGTQLITAISGRDYPVVQGMVLVYALIFVLINVTTDIVYTRLDPRVRLG